jgi:hypothetical protein
MATPTVRDEAIAALKRLPADATLEDLQYRLYVLEKIRKGEASLDKHGPVPHAKRSGDAEMAFEVSWSREALEDVDRVADYIARDSPAYAAGMVQRFSPRSNDSPTSPTWAVSCRS